MTKEVFGFLVSLAFFLLGISAILIVNKTKHDNAGIRLLEILGFMMFLGGGLFAFMFFVMWFGDGPGDPLTESIKGYYNSLPSSRDARKTGSGPSTEHHD